MQTIQKLLMFSVLFLGCGTEIGNGIRGKTDKGTTNPSDPAEKAFAEGSTTDLSTDAAGSKKFGSGTQAQAGLHLFARDASPFLEMREGTFSAGSQSIAFKVSAKDSSGAVTISFSGSQTRLSLKADPNVGAFAVSVDLQGYDALGSGPLSSAEAAGLRTRTISFADGFRTAWDVNEKGYVVAVRVNDAAGTEVLKLAYTPTATADISTVSADPAKTELSTSIDWKEVTPSTPKAFKDGMTGLLWAADNGQSYATVAAAETYCQSLSSGSSNWRLPTFTELNTAYDHEIGGRLANSQALDISAKFGAYWTGTKADSSSYWTINLVEPERSISIQKKTEPNNLSVLCVRDP